MGSERPNFIINVKFYNGKNLSEVWDVGMKSTQYHEWDGVKLHELMKLLRFWDEFNLKVEWISLITDF